MLILSLETRWDGEIGMAAMVSPLAIGEFYIWHAGLFWHEPRRDPRNFPTPDRAQSASAYAETRA